SSPWIAWAPASASTCFLCAVKRRAFRSIQPSRRLMPGSSESSIIGTLGKQMTLGFDLGLLSKPESPEPKAVLMVDSYADCPCRRDRRVHPEAQEVRRGEVAAGAAAEPRRYASRFDVPGSGRRGRRRRRESAHRSRGT